MKVTPELLRKAKEKAAHWAALQVCSSCYEIGSPARTRTTDPLINSQLLYQLSYRGIFWSSERRVWYWSRSEGSIDHRKGNLDRSQRLNTSAIRANAVTRFSLLVAKDNRK